MSRVVVYRQELQRTPPPSIWSRLVDGLRSITIPAKSLKDPELVRLFGGGSTSAGISVNEHTALNYSAVWAAVSLISSQIASLPLILYKRLPNGGKERFSSHQTYRLLHDEFNPEMSSMVARETLMAHVLTWGNAYCEIERDQLGRPIALWPLLPNQVSLFRDQALRLKYRVAAPGVPDAIIPAADILHVVGLGFDGLVGYSPIHMARESLALGIAAQRFGSAFFGNGATLSAVLEHPGELGEDGRKNLRESIEATHQGASKAHRLLILEEGMKYQKFGVDPNAAQFLETRQFEVTEVARWFNIPPHKLRELMRATFSNIEQQSIEFVTDTLRPWLVRWEQEINRKLIARPERNIQYVEHLVEGLLRGDIASRYNAYAVGRQWGWLSANDVRAYENLNPLPGKDGDIYMVPANMTTPERMMNPPEPKVLPAAPVESDADDEENDRHEALLTEIREGQQQVAFLRESLASQAQQIVAMDAQLAEAGKTQAAFSDQLAEAQGDVRERLQAEQAAHAKATEELAAARAELVARGDAWRDEKATREREVAEKQAEWERQQVADAARAEASIEAVKAEHAAELTRVREEAERGVAEALERAETDALTRADAAANDAAERERAAAAALVEATKAEHAAQLEALRQEGDAQLRQVEDEATGREAALSAASVERETALQAERNGAREERDAITARLAELTAEAAEVSAALESRAVAAEAVAAEQMERSEGLDARAVALSADVEAARAESTGLTAQLLSLQAELTQIQERAETAREAAETAIRDLQAALDQETTFRNEAERSLVEIRSQQEAREAEIVTLVEEHQRQRESDASALNASRTQLDDERETAAQIRRDAETLAGEAIAARDQAQAALAAADARRLESEERALVETEARAVAERGLTDLKVLESKRVSTVLSAHRALVADTMRRMIERESDRARRAQATPQKLRTWADSFYPAHEDLCRTALLPVVRVHLAWMRSEQDPAQFAADLARQHVEESLLGLRAVLDEDPEEFQSSLAALLHRWESERIGVIADRLMEKELDHARRTA